MRLTAGESGLYFSCEGEGKDGDDMRNRKEEEKGGRRQSHE